MLLISELFYSLQGETTLTGFPSFFIRTSGCNLNCTCCDTPHALAGGKHMTAEEIISNLSHYSHVHHVTVTGGEPLIQEGVCGLMDSLLEMKYIVQLETNGSLPLVQVPAGVRKIIDVKTPSSGEGGSFHLQNLSYISPADELKFLIADINDYDFARNFMEKNLEKISAVINLSPVEGRIEARELAEMILKDRLPVRLNIQIHKTLWPGGEPTGL